jgi:hypothetical protein
MYGNIIFLYYYLIENISHKSKSVIDTVGRGVLYVFSGYANDVALQVNTWLYSLKTTARRRKRDEQSYEIKKII